ncbi:MAG: hypothetical protein JWP81_177 [Ferruginibacter sp.]|nr:hypothetical protein [Ferruginibacter sp.]
MIQKFNLREFLGCFIPCILNKANTGGKEDSSQYPVKDDFFDIPCTLATIHKIIACQDKPDNT